MSPSEIYLKAAEMVANGSHTYPCTAVYAADPSHVNWYQPESLTRQFILTMAPGREAFVASGAASDAYLRKMPLLNLRSHSVLALCFMAAISDAS